METDLKEQQISTEKGTVSQGDILELFHAAGVSEEVDEATAAKVAEETNQAAKRAGYDDTRQWMLDKPLNSLTNPNQHHQSISPQK